MEAKQIHYFNIAIIKNKDNKLLLKYDQRWDCYLFVYKRMEETEGDPADEQERLKSYLESELKATLSNGEFKKRLCFEKYSHSANQMKLYDHRFYVYELTDKQEECLYLNSEYKWFSIEEMERDQNIVKKNSDFLKIAKDLI